MLSYLQHAAALCRHTSSSKEDNIYNRDTFKNIVKVSSEQQNLVI
jgi:hypothetical protein